MKCAICKETVKESFLKKILGTFVKDKQGKKHVVCQACQKQYIDKKDLLSRI